MTLKKIMTVATIYLFSAGLAVAGVMEIEQPYARASSPIAKSGAAFMKITNNSAEDDILIAVFTDAAKRSELHTHILEGDIAKMRKIEGGIVVLAGETIWLKRGGNHVMLMGLTRPFVTAQTITLTLIFAKAGEIRVVVPVDNERLDIIPEAMQMQMSDKYS